MAENHFFDSYLTGIPDLDEDHLSLYNLLVEATSLIEQHNYSVAFVTLETLRDQFVYHCAMEEALMKKIKYPWLDGHINDHVNLKRTLISVIDLLVANKDLPSPEITTILVDALVRILLDHIKQCDLKIAHFIVSEVTSPSINRQ